jgi:hypothetical protein
MLLGTAVASNPFSAAARDWRIGIGFANEWPAASRERLAFTV